MYEPMIFRLVSLGVAMSGEPLVDLRHVWKKMTLLDGVNSDLSFEQRAIVTRARILMFDGQVRFFTFLQAVCRSLPDAPWRNELNAMINEENFAAFIEDNAFISRYMKRVL